MNQFDITVDQFSLTSIRLTMMRDDMELAVGSGMLWKNGDKRAIVTAWHNLTGVHFETRKSLSAMGARPNKLKATFLTGAGGTVVNLIADLRTATDACTWYVHRHGSEKVDLAVLPIPLEFPKTSINLCANELAEASIAINVGSELSIVGYPMGIERMGLPIWKRATLAIEPMAIFDDDTNRFAIVDSATRQGLSGAPVYARREGMALSADGKMTFATSSSTRIFGIYTGRLAHSDALDAQLGIVWPIQYVREMFENGIQDNFNG